MEAHRDWDDAWFVLDRSGNGRWSRLEGGKLPEGWSFYRYADGGKVSATAPGGAVDFYATWEEPASCTVRYHASDGAAADQRTTRVVVGTPTATSPRGLPRVLLGIEQVRRMEGAPRLGRRLVRARPVRQRQVEQARGRKAARGLELLPLRRRRQGFGDGARRRGRLLRHLGGARLLHRPLPRV